MARTVIHEQSLDQILTPFERPEDARWDAVAWGASLTVNAGDMIAIKAADKLAYPYAAGGAGGLGVAVGLSKFSFMTGTDGKPIKGAASATPNYLTGGGDHTAPIYLEGTFDITEIKEGGVAVANLAAVVAAFSTKGVVQNPNGSVKIAA